MLTTALAGTSCARNRRNTRPSAFTGDISRSDAPSRARAPSAPARAPRTRRSVARRDGQRKRARRQLVCKRELTDTGTERREQSDRSAPFRDDRARRDVAVCVELKGHGRARECASSRPASALSCAMQRDSAVVLQIVDFADRPPAIRLRRADDEMSAANLDRHRSRRRVEDGEGRVVACHDRRTATAT